MAMAASSTNGSKMGASMSGGSTWKWSYSQSDSKPRVSAHRATSTVCSQAERGSIPRYSRSQPWGSVRPILTPAPRRS